MFWFLLWIMAFYIVILCLIGIFFLMDFVIILSLPCFPQKCRAIKVKHSLRSDCSFGSCRGEPVQEFIKSLTHECSFILFQQSQDKGHNKKWTKRGPAGHRQSILTRAFCFHTDIHIHAFGRLHTTTLLPTRHASRGIRYIALALMRLIGLEPEEPAFKSVLLHCYSA